EKDSDVYKRARVDRKLFSKIRSNPEYRPSKTTALAFALALHLDLDETNELIGRAGYVLSHSSRADLIAEYFITNGNYDIDALNEVLFAYDLPLIGGVA
ncbi:MAG: RNase III inhibitor, partial [Firmicutes bacterium]|nr:RNase III inhibitor [Bacillota bacterium]